MPSAHPKGLLGHFPHRPTPSCICNQGRSGGGGWAVVLWLRNKLSLGSEHARTFRSGPQDRENQSEDNHTSLLSPQHSEGHSGSPVGPTAITFSVFLSCLRMSWDHFLNKLLDSNQFPGLEHHLRALALQLHPTQTRAAPYPKEPSHISKGHKRCPLLIKQWSLPGQSWLFHQTG